MRYGNLFENLLSAALATEVNVAGSDEKETVSSIVHGFDHVTTHNLSQLIDKYVDLKIIGLFMDTSGAMTSVRQGLVGTLSGQSSLHGTATANELVRAIDRSLSSAIKPYEGPGVGGR